MARRSCCSRLLLGMAMNFLGDDERCRPGIDVAGRHVLRLGVALLGFRITLGQIAALGPSPVLLVVAAVALTIVFSVLLAWAMGFNPLFGLLSGGATAICGASAALALSAALPAASAQGAGDPVHHRRRVDPVDASR